MNKTILYNVEAREALKRGVDAVANAVKVTLGPQGRHVIIEREHQDAAVTKDGVTVARSIHVPNQMENIGAQLVKHVAGKTLELVGDGTTTATVLAQAILEAGIKNVAAGANPMELKKGMDAAVKIVVESLKENAIIISNDIKKIRQIAVLSANGDTDIGNKIADAVNKVGPDGIITVEESTNTETYVDLVNGLQFNRGYISPFFVNKPEKMEAEFLNPDILIVNKAISEAKQLIPLIDKQVSANMRPLLIICDDLTGDALTLLVQNRMKNNMPFVAVKSPSHSDLAKAFLQDMAIFTNATVISDESGILLDKAQLSCLGSAGRVVVTRSTTTIYNGKYNPIAYENLIDELKFQIGECKNDFEKSKLKERLAKVSASIGVIYVGAQTEVETKEKMDRVDDALHATKAAIEEGMVPGGGVALIRMIPALNKHLFTGDQETGRQIIRAVLEEPLKQICLNAGDEGSVVVERVKKGTGDFGYNARTGKYEKLIAAGVIDPVKVVRTCIENAVSIASMLLTTECVVGLNHKKPEPTKNH